MFSGIHDSNASLLPHLVGRKPPFSVVSTEEKRVIAFAQKEHVLKLSQASKPGKKADPFVHGQVHVADPGEGEVRRMRRHERIAERERQGRHFRPSLEAARCRADAARAVRPVPAR